MSLVVNTNVASLNAQRSLSASSNELKTAMERLSSGKKINSAADDAAGFAIAERMTAQIRGLNMATKNANDGLSMLAVIENATNDVTDMLQRMRELAIQAANGTNGTADRSFLDAEVQSLVSEIDRVANNTEYNGTTILDGTLTNKNIQVGTEAGQTVSFSVSSIEKDEIGVHDSKVKTTAAAAATTVTIKDAVKAYEANQSIKIGNSTYTIASVGTFSSGEQQLTLATGLTAEAAADGTVTGAKIADIDVSANATTALATISAAIEQVAGDRAAYGALQNRLEYTVSNLMNVAEFTTSARSRIEDADFAAESARLAKAQVLQQTGTAMLAQANVSPKLALSLIK
ncbi:MAG: flagellin [Betaproteobacteria bacterium]|jgi:flagellin